jgi:hypothetical protein
MNERFKRYFAHFSIHARSNKIISSISLRTGIRFRSSVSYFSSGFFCGFFFFQNSPDFSLSLPLSISICLCITKQLTACVSRNKSSHMMCVSRSKSSQMCHEANHRRCVTKQIIDILLCVRLASIEGISLCIINAYRFPKIKAHGIII